MSSTAEQLSTRHLLGIKDLNESDIQLILNTASNFKEVLNRPIKKFLHCVILQSQMSFLKTLRVHVYHSS